MPDRDFTRKHDSGRNSRWINCKNDRGAPTANSGDAAGTFTITIAPEHREQRKVRLNETLSSEMSKRPVVAWLYWKATLKTCSGHRRDGFSPAISGVRANDLAQLMREKFRVKVCERVDCGFLTTEKILRGEMALNAGELFWMYDPAQPLALAGEFGFVDEKQLEQTKSMLVAPGSITLNKGLHDGVDVLDQRETQQEGPSTTGAWIYLSWLFPGDVFFDSRLW